MKKIKKININQKSRMLIFAFLMSFVTSATVSTLVLLLTKNEDDNLSDLWVTSLMRAWPTVFILILIFVPILNKLIDTFFETKK